MVSAFFPSVSILEVSTPAWNRAIHCRLLLSGEKIIVEIDGETHGSDYEMLKDRQRETYLRSLGLQIIRYTNEEILKSLEGVLDDLARRV
ncbi:MAG: DUF559 domain-containing protein [Candidatus Manganitrophaceae bacterium]|nr:MAG: DUF559 domain-containing protein [Candidatus Manganitrophaceae bacterium]